MDKLDKIAINESDLDKIKQNKDFGLVSKGKNNFVFEYRGTALVVHRNEKDYFIFSTARKYEEAINAVKETINYKPE